MPFWLTALGGFLIVARVTRFLNADYLAGGLRAWVMERFGDGKIYYLVTCPWCASIWIAAPVSIVAVVTLSPYAGWAAVWLTVALWLGYSYAYGILSGALDGDE